MPALTIAVPKGRILTELLPVMERWEMTLEPDFYDPDSRKLRFATSRPDVSVIRVRSFDVPTFVAHGAAQLGIAGSDVLMECDTPELYAPVDLGIGKCRLCVAARAEEAATLDLSRESHVRVATKYPVLTRRFFAERGIQAECIKLNGAMELAPAVGLSRLIVDLVSTGKTLEANGLAVVETLAHVSSRLIVHRSSFKTRGEELQEWIDAVREAVDAGRASGSKG